MAVKHMIYRDPITQTDQEGEATLVEYIAEVGIVEGKTLECWRVRFDGESDLYYRNLLVDESAEV